MWTSSGVAAVAIVEFLDPPFARFAAFSLIFAFVEPSDPPKAKYKAARTTTPHNTIKAVAHAGNVSRVLTGTGATTCLSTTGLSATVRPVTGSSILSTAGVSATAPALNGRPQFGHAVALFETS